MVHQRGLISGVGLDWTPMPSIGSCGLHSSKITTAAGERDKGEGEREREHGEGGKNDGYVLHGVLILF